MSSSYENYLDSSLNIKVPKVSVRSHGVCSYSQYESRFVKSPFRSLSVEEKRSLGWLTHDRTSQGVLSPGARKRLRNAVGWTINNAMFAPSKKPIKMSERIRRCSFITLTLPSKQMHSDQVIKKVALNNFLNYCRRELHTNAYCWRAEKQKNGNIHFHLVMDKYCKAERINKMWLKSLESLGYVDAYQKNMKSKIKTLEDYAHYFGKGLFTSTIVRRFARLQETNFREPNCTDVHSLRKVRNALKYVCKYLVKCEDTELVSGKLWGCSQSISKISKASFDADTKLLAELEVLAQEKPSAVFEGDFFTWFSCSMSELFQLKLFNILALFEELLQRLNSELTLSLT